MVPHPQVGQSKASWQTATWTVTAAFGVYFCMYAFRKPFTAASFAGDMVGDVDFKTVVVTLQVLGYMLSKFIGIKFVSETPPERRASSILVLILLAELSLVGFGWAPRPWNAAFLFLNGLSLGMVFGLVLGFLEGRRLTEALTAGLCVSFILADGVAKSVGAWLLQWGVSEDWMPSAAGVLFLPPLCIGLAMLREVPPPDGDDIAERAARRTLDRSERWALYRRYAAGLTLLIGMYLLTTILRSVRADFAPELWVGLGEPAAPGTFTRSEMCVALGVLAVNGAAVYFRDNRVAFGASLLTCGVGFVVVALAIVAYQAESLDAFWFMVLVGFGLYLPYVAVHTTVFERWLALTRERGNLGFLMYVADAIGYLGYVVVLLTRRHWIEGDRVLPFFLRMSWLTVALSLLCLAFSWRFLAADESTARSVPCPKR